MPERSRHRRLVVIAAAAVVSTVMSAVACTRTERSDADSPSAAVQSGTGSGELERPTPAPSFSGSIESARLTDVLAYARSLRYDTTARAGAEQRLFAGPRERRIVGPVARLHEEVGVRHLERPGRQQGRILARIVKDGPPFAPLGIVSDTSYFWVDSTTGKWRAFMIPGDTTHGRPVQLSLVYDPRIPMTKTTHIGLTRDSTRSIMCAYDSRTGDHQYGGLDSAALDSLFRAIQQRRDSLRRDSLRRDSIRRDSARGRPVTPVRKSRDTTRP